MKFAHVVEDSSGLFFPIGVHFADFKMADMEALFPSVIQGHPGENDLEVESAKQCIFVVWEGIDLNGVGGGEPKGVVSKVRKNVARLQGLAAWLVGGEERGAL